MSSHDHEVRTYKGYEPDRARAQDLCHKLDQREKTVEDLSYLRRDYGGRMCPVNRRRGDYRRYYYILVAVEDPYAYHMMANESKSVLHRIVGEENLVRYVYAKRLQERCGDS